jgi:hypothetical protein
VEVFESISYIAESGKDLANTYSQQSQGILAKLFAGNSDKTGFSADNGNIYKPSSQGLVSKLLNSEK